MFERNLGRQRKKLIERLFAEDLKDPVRGLGHRRRYQQGMRGRVQLEVLFRMSQRIVRHQSGDVRELGGLGFEKFAPGRSVEEQIVHRDRRSRRSSGVVAAQNLTSSDLDAGAGDFLRRACLHLQSRYRGDGGQSLPPESKRGNG